MIRHLARRDRPLTTLQMERRYHNIVSAARRHFGSWNKAVLAAGIKPTKLLRVIPWNEERVIEAILTRALRNESLAARVVEPQSLVEAGHRFFGGWVAAITPAGLDLATTEPPPRRTKRSRVASARASSITKVDTPRVPWNNKRVVAGILARVREQKPIHLTALPSTVGVGYADSSDGVVVGQPINTVEIRYTVMGDANLDRVVNLNDALRLRASWNATGSPSWDRGNFNYDSAVNGTDALIMGRNLNVTATGTTTRADSVALTAVNNDLMPSIDSKNSRDTSWGRHRISRKK